jgi:hypothetical protein
MAETKRPLFFTSQFLVEGDFKAEQDYHADLRRLHNISLHSWGIVKGLDVGKTAIPRQVAISAGMAIDSAGREIALSQDRAPQNIDLTAGTTVFITISYNEEFLKEDLYTGAGLRDKFTRATLRPKIEAVTSAPDDGSVIKLARVTVTADDVKIDSSVRRLASSLIAKGSNLELNDLSLSGNLSIGAGKEIVFADNGQIRSLDNNHKLVFNRAANLLELHEFGDIRFLTGSPPSEKMRINAAGNVGIGLPNPTEKLHLSSAGSTNIRLASGGGGGSRIDFVDALNNVTTSIGHVNNVGVFQVGVGASSPALTILGNGNLGIGTASPAARLDVVGGAIRPSAGNAETAGIMFPKDPGGGASDAAWIRYYARTGEETTLEIGIANDPQDHISLMPTGNVGIGTLVPVEPLEVNGRIKSGALTVGSWPANTNYVFFGTNALDQKDPGNYALLQGAIDQKGITFLNSPESIRFRIKNGDKMVLTKEGEIGIGTTNPNGPLDVANRVRFGFDEGGSGPRVITFARDAGDEGNSGKIAYKPSWDPAALGIVGAGASPNRKVTMWDNVLINGRLQVTGPKTGYVADQFVNNIGETLEQGDVVVIGANQSSLFYGLNNSIPIAEVDLTDTAYDTRVCGIVCEAYGKLAPESEQESEPESKSKKSAQAKGSKKAAKAQSMRPQEFTSEELENLDRDKVEPGQLGFMVTLGAFAHCKVDADIASINVGDLLTTSPTKGHAQKAIDSSKATGAIIGKALGSLKKGKGKIPVIVTL